VILFSQVYFVMMDRLVFVAEKDKKTTFLGGGHTR
jgi:hypothetical protein